MYVYSTTIAALNVAQPCSAAPVPVPSLDKGGGHANDLLFIASLNWIYQPNSPDEYERKAGP